MSQYLYQRDLGYRVEVRGHSLTHDEEEMGCLCPSVFYCEAQHKNILMSCKKVTAKNPKP